MKRIILAGSIVLIGFSLFLLSACQKEEESCSCKDSYGGRQNVYPSSYGAKTCSDLALKLRADSGDWGISCN